MTNTERQAIKERLIKTILSNNSLQMDWNANKKLFNSIYPDFFYPFQIQGIYLTHKEEQLLLLETLLFNTNSIAKILGILPNSVYTSRYRLNKKINEARFQIIKIQ